MKALTTINDNFLDLLDSEVEALPTPLEGDLLRFDGNTGAWSIGQEKDEVEYGARAVLNIQNLSKGYRRWALDAKNKKRPVDVFFPLGTTPVMPSNEPPEGLMWAPKMNPSDPDWKPCFQVTGVLTPSGRRWSFTADSKGAERAFGDLVRNLHALIKSVGKPVFPIVALEEANDGRGYKSSYGQKYSPRFTFTGESSESFEVSTAEANGQTVEIVEEPVAAPAAARKARKAK